MLNQLNKVYILNFDHFWTGFRIENRQDSMLTQRINDAKYSLICSKLLDHKKRWPYIKMFFPQDGSGPDRGACWNF